jgi:ribosome-associated toxin RatA of RatAB toxin-antitoxin module
MTVINRSALVPFPVELMYQLVNDIEAYPQFMEGCVGAKIIARGDDWIEARLDLAKARLHYSFTTRNRLTPPHEIDLTLVEGPFEYFSGRWAFQPLGASACKVSLNIDFEMAGKLMSFAAKTLFNSVANQLVDQLVKRAHMHAKT